MTVENVKHIWHNDAVKLTPPEHYSLQIWCSKLHAIWFIHMKKAAWISMNLNLFICLKNRGRGLATGDEVANYYRWNYLETAENQKHETCWLSHNFILMIGEIFLRYLLLYRLL